MSCSVLALEVLDLMCLLRRCPPDSSRVPSFAPFLNLRPMLPLPRFCPGWNADVKGGILLKSEKKVVVKNDLFSKLKALLKKTSR